MAGHAHLYWSMLTSVQPPPEKPVLIWDGDCGFCRRSVERLHHTVGEAIDYVPYQQRDINLRQIPTDQLQETVHFVDADGSVSQGAEAIFRACAHAPGGGRSLRLYQRFPPFRWASESVYRIVAQNRSFLSRFF